MIIVLNEANLNKSLESAGQFQVIRDFGRLLLLNMVDLFISDTLLALDQLIGVDHGHEAFFVLLSLLLDLLV